MVLANSMYNRIGKSANEEVHFVEKMITHPEYVCTLKIFTIKFQLNAELNLPLCFFL